MTRSQCITILIGMILIGVITPLSQFLTAMTLNVDLETATPVGWAVGLVFSLVLVFAALRVVFRNLRLPRRNMVILYSMLTLAVPMMNLGLIRPFYNSVYSIFSVYFDVSDSSYQTLYKSLNESWFPRIPTMEGLAWAKSDRLLRLLQDREGERERQRTAEEIGQLMTDWIVHSGIDQPEQGEVDIHDALEPEEAERLIGMLGPDEILGLFAMDPGGVLGALNLRERMDKRLEVATRESAEAAGWLQEVLVEVDEMEVSLLPEVMERMNPSALDRQENEMRRLGEERRRELERRVAEEVAPIMPRVREAATKLSRSNLVHVRNFLEEQYKERFDGMEEEEYEWIFGNFVYRLDREERHRIIRMDGTDGPNQNLRAFREGLWSSVQAQQRREQQSLWQNLRETMERIPWALWLRPILWWGALFTAIYLFLMCVAEWLRRKWVEGENLAFPLVEIADHMIRHDSELETAVDPTSPPARKRTFNPYFLGGAAVGFLILSMEAMSHYNLVSGEYRLFFNVSENVFTTGALKEMDKVFLVISPIVVGIVFLLSLEIGFSIWCIFVLYTGISWMIGLGTTFQDPFYVGGHAGRSFPYPMEQMLGACLCFAIILLYKAWKSSGAGNGAPGGEERGASAGHYVPPRWNRIGLVGLPVVILGLLWNLGITHLPFLLVFGLLMLALVIAGARLRAETGMPSHHVTYEFTKFPMVFGLTGIMGAKVFSVFITLMFLPWTLLFRALPQHLENMELARRHGLRYGVLAVAGVAAFGTALVVGLGAYLIYSYYLGGAFQGVIVHPDQPLNAHTFGTKALWMSHQQGEYHLDQWTRLNTLRITFIVVGFAVMGLLAFCRWRFLNFPLHPFGYLLLLLSIYYYFISPYYKGDERPTEDASWLWGSAFVAWGIKKLIIKYGGMNGYRAAKPFFIGLVVGSVFCLFFWNMMDLAANIAAVATDSPDRFGRVFLNNSPYNPKFY